MGQLIKNGVNYTGATGIIDGVGSTSSALALSANQGNKLANDMGAVELLDTAVNSYNVGQYFVWESQFVKVIANITAGDTIISGINVTPTNIGAVLTELNSNIVKIDTFQATTDSNGVIPLYNKTYTTSNIVSVIGSVLSGGTCRSIIQTYTASNQTYCYLFIVDTNNSPVSDQNVSVTVKYI